MASIWVPIPNPPNRATRPTQSPQALKGQEWEPGLAAQQAVVQAPAPLRKKVLQAAGYGRSRWFGRGSDPVPGFFPSPTRFLHFQRGSSLPASLPFSTSAKPNERKSLIRRG